VITILQNRSKYQRRAKRKHLDKRLQMLLRRAKLIEDELLLLQSEEEYYRVCIFGSARIKSESPQYAQVAALAEKLSRKGIDILTGGGPGLMEAANLGAQQGSLSNRNSFTKSSEAAQQFHENSTEHVYRPGKSYGISIELPFEPIPNRHLDIKRHHHKFSSRLDDFVRLSHAIIVTPGGVGTLLELFFCWQLIQVKHVPIRPIILIDRSYWEGIVQWLRDFPLERALVSPQDFEYVTIADSVDEACSLIFEHHDAFRKALTARQAEEKK
jgi:uncharacterized protein (TIGR00730 family)